MPVYFIGNGNGQVKIGYSREPLKRLATLQTASPHRLQLLAIIPGTEKDEEELHSKFAQYRLAGEWFTLSDSIDDEIESFGRYEAEVIKTCDSPELAPVGRRLLPGRPPKDRPAEVIRLVLSLDPIEHSDLIATFLSAPARGRSAIATDMMARGLARVNRKQQEPMRSE